MLFCTIQDIETANKYASKYAVLLVAESLTLKLCQGPRETKAVEENIVSNYALQ